MTVITSQDRAAIRRIFQKTRGETDPMVAAKARRSRVEQHPKMADIIAAQNTLRVCMEVVLNECLPYDEFFCGEIAVRLAAYAVSAVPVERQQMLTEAVQRALPATLANKLREGAVVKSTWITNGVEHPNVPEKGDVQ